MASRGTYFVMFAVGLGMMKCFASHNKVTVCTAYADILVF